MKTLIIDNYDSFTYNLYQLIASQSRQMPIVIKNDELSIVEIQSLQVDNIIISPGPGRPDIPTDFGVCRDLILEIDVPLLGVCLGMQGIVYAFGGKIQHAPEQMHGRTSSIHHDHSVLFSDIPQTFTAMRYHSLIVNKRLPDCLDTIAWTDDRLVMGVRHKTKPIWGVQFHPESIGTEYGDQLIRNFLALAKNKKVKYKNKSKPLNETIISGESLQKIHNTPENISGKLYPNIKEFPKWIEPQEVFDKLYKYSENCYWLDSSRVDNNQARFSFMGDSSGPHSAIILFDKALNEIKVTRKETITNINIDIMEFLNEQLHSFKIDTAPLPFSFSGGYVGWLGYEIGYEVGYESANTTGGETYRGTMDNEPNDSSLNHVDAGLLFSDQFIVFDHQQKQLYLVVLLPQGEAVENHPWFLDVESKLNQHEASQPLTANTPHSDILTFSLAKSRSQYLHDIHKAKDLIREGESYEICLTNQISVDTQQSGQEIYRSLRKISPAPYSSYLKIGELEILSSSPEQFLKIDRAGNVSTKPIKGTIRRGDTLQEDEKNKQFLKTNTKDRAENLMIVDLLRNDLGRVCQTGSVHVSRLLDVESYATVHQLVSTVEGKLSLDANTIDCVRAAFPGGSMTGAPKIRTMRLLKVLEERKRGIYSGAIGYFSLDGSCDLSIVIRTIIKRNNTATFGVGGAIVSLSDPNAEFDEIMLKAKSLIKAIVLAEKGDYRDEFYQITGLN